MKRSLFFCTVSLLAGIYSAYFFSGTFPFRVIAGLTLLLLVASLVIKKGRVPFFLILFFLVGAFCLRFANDVTRRPLFPYLNEYITVTAECVEEPVYDEENEKYTVTARVVHVSFLKEEQDLKETVLLTVKQGETVPRFGERFSAVCLLYIPQEAMNRGGFDYALYLKSKGIFFRGTVEPDTLMAEESFPLSLVDRMYQLNRQCSQKIAEHIPKSGAALLQAVALGNKTNLTENYEEKLQVSGLSHMTSVSGMHVTALMSLLYALCKLIKRSRYKYIGIFCIILLIFMLFTGATPSVIRATVMGLSVLVAYLFRRRADYLTSLGVAAAVLALCNPLVAFDGGFILSFGAMLGFLLFAEPITEFLVKLFKLQERTGGFPRLLAGIFSIVSASFSVQLVLLPLMSAMFGYISLWGFLTNILVAWVVPFLLIGGLLIGFLGFVHPVLAIGVSYGVYPFAKLFTFVAAFFGERSEGLYTVAAFSWFGAYCYGLGLFIFHSVLYKKLNRVVVPLVSLLILGLLYFPLAEEDKEQAKITFINVGQGDCALVELPDDIDILIDAGGTPAYQGSFDVGKQIVLPYLRKKGINDLDYVVASHPHEDHILGIGPVMEYIPVAKLIVPIGFGDVELGAELLSIAANEGTEIVTVSKGDDIRFSENCTGQVLMPGAAELMAMEDENNKSLILWLSYYENTVLFTGDMAIEEESELLKEQLPAEGADILKVAHHGSKDSTSDAFLQWAKPAYAYIPCGKNQFGHPSDEVLERLSACGTTVYRADEDKDVCFVLNEFGIKTIRKGGEHYED